MAQARTLVVGATGAVGSAVVRGLVARGRPVRAFVRERSDRSALAGLDVETVAGDLKDPASVERACAGVDAVVTTANSAGRGGEDTVESVDRRGNATLVEAAARAGVDRFVFVSAKHVTPDDPVPFLRAKAETEVLLRASDMHHTILRGDIFREDWWGMVVAMPLAQGREVLFLGNEERRHTFLAARDMAACAVAALDRAYAKDRTLDVGGPDALSWLEVVALFEKALDRRIPVRSLPPGEDLPGLPPFVSHLLRNSRSSVTDMTRNAKELGVRLTPAEETVRAMLAQAR